MRRPILPAALLALALSVTGAHAAADYGNRLQKLGPDLEAKLVGRWTNPVDKVVIEITSIDLVSGQIKGKEWPSSGQGKGVEHDLIGWVNAAPVSEKFDNVLPVSFSTAMFEYGTLPSWAGYFKDGKIVTMHYLVWPNKTYSWDHISSFQETWSRIP